MPPADVKVDLTNVDYSKLPNVLHELWNILQTVLRESKLFCSFLPLLCILEGTEVALEYAQGMLLGDLVGSVSRQDISSFSTLMLWITGTSLMDAVINTLKVFLTGYSSVIFRQVLTQQLHEKYFRKHNFYKLNNLDPISNPDQRIGSDVEVLAEYICWMISTILTTPFTITYYAVIVGQTLGWMYPFIVIGYFLLILVLGQMLRKPIVPRVCNVRKLEGRFRQQHLDVVENAEKVAFIHDGDKAEYGYTRTTFKELLRALKIVQYFTIPVYFVMRLDHRMVFIVTYLICGTRLISLDDKLSESEISSAWTKMVFVVSNLGAMCHKYIDIISYLIYIEAMIRRVGELMSAMDDSCASINEQDTQGKDDEDPKYVLKNLTVVGPNSKTLIRKLNFEFNPQSSILIAGPSNVGKTSLFRVLRKLWPSNEGQISFTGKSSSVLFVGQQAFYGGACHSLRSTIIYPLTRREADDVPMIEHILNTLRLTQILKALENNLDKNWENLLAVLSSGERQRLSLARVLFHKPRIAFLDEATNALDKDLVDVFFEECRAHCITTVTISHNRENLYQYHDYLLEIHEDGTWELESLTAKDLTTNSINNV